MKRNLLVGALITWFAGVSYTMIGLSSSHTLSFFADTALAAKDGSYWSLTHVLGKGCKCSRLVYEYLLKRGPQKDLQENIILIGNMPDEASALKSRGFNISQKNEQELDSEKAVGVPFLLITSPQGEGVYAGGYSSHTVTAETRLLDLDILASLRHGKTISEFPIFGCAVSERMRRLTDPFSLKYKESQL